MTSNESGPGDGGLQRPGKWWVVPTNPPVLVDGNERQVIAQ
jgi:hypothetical protein